MIRREFLKLGNGEGKLLIDEFKQVLVRICKTEVVKTRMPDLIKIFSVSLIADCIMCLEWQLAHRIWFLKIAELHSNVSDLAT